MLISPSDKRSATPEKRSAVPVRFRSWLLLVVAFGFLLLLMVGSDVATLRRAAELHTTISRVNETHLRNTRTLEQVRSGVQGTRLLIRDFLLDESPHRAEGYRTRLSEFRTSIETDIRALNSVNEAKAKELLIAFGQYCARIEPMLGWSVSEGQHASYAFLRESVTPLRERVSSIANEIEAHIDTSLRDTVAQLARREADFNLFLTRMMFAAAILGLMVAFASVFRVRMLEGRSAEQHRITEQAEQEMRRLSHQLVHAQEDERRSISRELHDEVGQMLTGLRMEFRSLAKLHGAPRAEFDTRLEQGRVLLDQTLQAVRDIAMGLRPSMLDDLGLDAALRWQVREFGRRHDIPVTLNVDADLSNLPEQHRTNLYRIVQEALTNCARHAQAKSVTITIAYKSGDLRLVVADDGVGLARPDNPGGGLGLIGIQERARDLGGSVRLDSAPGRGTSLAVSVPADWRPGHARHTSTVG